MTAPPRQDPVGEPQVTVDPPLLEREDDLAELASAFARARAGRGSFVLLAGAPGIGKSALLAAARTAARDHRLEVLAANATELERESTFGVTLQLFESRIARTGDEDRARLLSGAARLAAPLLAKGPREAFPEGQAFSLLHGLYWLCSNLAAEAPLALAIDDAQWADGPTLRLLLYLAQRIEELPVAVVLTASPGAGSWLDGGLLPEIAEHPATTRLELRPLTLEGVARLLRASHFPGAAMGFCRACYHATGGNPYLVQELALALAEKGIEPTERATTEIAKAAPDAVARRVLRRAADVGGVGLARAAAVLGDEAELRHAAELAGIDSAEAAIVSDALREVDVLQRVASLSFIHPVVRRALAESHPPAERAEAYLCAAQILAREGAPAERVARHLMRARSSASRWVTDVLREASGAALDRGSPEAACRYLERALAEPPDAARRTVLALELARAETIAGRSGAVERLLEATDKLEDPLERARSRLETGRVLHAQGRPKDAAEAFKKGISELNGDDDRLLAQLRTGHATAARGLRARRAEEGSGEPGVSAYPHEETSDELVSLAQLAAERVLSGNPREEVVGLAVRALSKGALLREETCDGLGYYEAAFALTVAEEFQTAEFALTAAVEDALSRGSVLGLATARYYRALAILSRGRLNDAAGDAQGALSAENSGWRLAVPGARAVLAERFVEQGDLRSASREVWRGTRGGVGGDDLARCLCLMSRAHVHLLQQRRQMALDEFLALGRRMEDAGIHNPAVASWRSGAALAAAALGDTPRAVSVAEEELSLARKFGALGAIGRALHVLGLVQGGDEGLETLGKAVATLESSPAALDRARGLVDYGGALRRAGRRRAAREPLLAGRDLAHRLGAEALSKRATEELLAAGARPRRTATSGAEALTPRERQVAELAAQGLSNREIAETLFITIKTVEWHLRHSYGKLGVKTRQELVPVLGTDEMSLSLSRAGDP